MMDDRLGKIHFWLISVSMYLMFVLMHFQGMGGALRRMFDHNAYEYTAGVRGLHLPISILGFIAAGAQAIFLWNFFWSIFRGKKADANPWQSAGLEWSTPASPAPHGNWGDAVPSVNRWPYDYTPNGKTPDFVPQAELATPVESGAK
jgi:cytochrome c oxidase subunit 1